MKIIQYFLVFVVFGLLSTAIGGDQFPHISSDDNAARWNGMNASPQILLPRIYVPAIPQRKDYLNHYSPDNYCTFTELKEFTLQDVSDCFKVKERWMRLNRN